MTSEHEYPEQRLQAIADEEAGLARAALAGDREAFDLLYDRYLCRMAHVFRDLPDTEAQAKIWETLEQIFASLHHDDDGLPLAARAFRVAQASRGSSTRVPVFVRRRAETATERLRTER